MNIEEKKEIASMLMVRAELTGRTLSPQAIAMMVEDVSDLNPKEVINLLKNWGKTETSFPHPAQIREKIAPVINQDDDISESVNRAIVAVSKFGRPNSEAARKHIGELGWAIVIGKFGSWSQFCIELGAEIPEGVAVKQMLEYGETVWKRHKAGINDEAPALPTPTTLKIGNEQISLVMKGMDE